MSAFDPANWGAQSVRPGSDHHAVLGPSDCPAVSVINGSGQGSFVFGCEHAGNRIPGSLGTLGLSRADLNRHIAWDIGAARLAEFLSDTLDSPAVLQAYSRLVYDCNRTASHPGAFVEEADGTFVAGNAALGAQEKAAREAAVYHPFHDGLSALLDRRRMAGERLSYVAVHSFNPEVRGQRRPWDVGFIYNQHATMSRFMIDWFRRHTGYAVGDNQPYSPLDAVDHTLRVQAEARSIPCTMIEVRNDHLRSEKGIGEWAVLIARALRAYDAQHQ